MSCESWSPSFLDGAVLINQTEIASLWSGYGKIYRLEYAPAAAAAAAAREAGDARVWAIKKQVIVPRDVESSEMDESFIRKVKSYKIERYFYKHFAERLPPDVRVPSLYRVRDDAPSSLVMTDLNVSFPVEHQSMNLECAKVVLTWLAGFHSTFWGAQDAAAAIVEPGPSTQETSVEGVWEEGGYWCLRTRMGREFQALSPPWRRIAHDIDVRIRRDIPNSLVTLIHGDCKAANILFSKDSSACALFDFQYVGRGPAVRDVLYFFASSVPNLDVYEDELLQYYHRAIQHALKSRGMHEVAEEYDFLTMISHYEYCLLDYHRFLLGWVSFLSPPSR